MTITIPVVVQVSHATRLIGSCSINASRMASEMASHILSGCPSVTDSEVNNVMSLFIVNLLYHFGIYKGYRGLPVSIYPPILQVNPSFSTIAFNSSMNSFSGFCTSASSYSLPSIPYLLLPRS